MSLPPALPQIVTLSPSSPDPSAKSGALADPLRRPGPWSRSFPAPTGNSPVSAYFEALFAAYGPQHWWPGQTRFEIIVGAILTQNTSWRNARRAITNLRARKLLSPLAIHKVSASRLSACIRPAGYFRQKSQTLKTFAAFLFRSHRGSLNRLFATPTHLLREQLLGLRGIGPETADCILLYAGKQAVFVVDAYARRILERHGLAQPRATYAELRATFESALPRDQRIFNEFHALIVETGKVHCRKSNPACHACPLEKFLPVAGGAPRASLASPVTPP